MIASRASSGACEPLRARIRHRFAFAAMSIGLLAACVPPTGGWDVEALSSSEPRIAALDGSRIGDMIPFPALADALDPDTQAARIGLVACRFRERQRVHVRGAGERWPEEWARRAVTAVDRSVGNVDLLLDSTGPSISGEASPSGDAGPRPEIRVAIVQDGPSGLGDTLVECDVTPLPGSNAVRGELVDAEVRMRRAQFDIAGRIREASPEEWVGAFMHELGHALGFAGHAAMGRTIMVRDEVELRALGRHALEGRWSPDPTLEALYALPPGRPLGSRALGAESTGWLRALRRLHGARARTGPALVGVFSSVGDRSAQLVWRYVDGSRQVVRLPDWRRELRRGDPITLVPDTSTRRQLGVLRD